MSLTLSDSDSDLLSFSPNHFHAKKMKTHVCFVHLSVIPHNLFNKAT
uniref:Uncharacterized protein n=1 Tax=Arundo donax TaxID=35708 RepID=A0A0A9H0I3_ARUDO